MERLLKGQFEYDDKSLDFSVPRVEISLGPDEEVEGSFTIFGPENRFVTGRISSTDLRMEVITPEFTGSPYEVSYRYDSRGLSKGDVHQGNFRIISNQGEYVLPFVVTVRHDHITSSLGDIKNLFHFANLAKTDWEEAVDLFYSKDFISVFQGNDSQYESLYRGLSVGRVNEQNVEEFLISINKKKPVEYIIDQEEIHIDFTGTTHDYGILITRNGWGYTDLHADVDGDFISLDKTDLSDESFSGSSCHIKIRLRTEMLHEGNNFGRIIFRNAFIKTEIPVTVAVELTGRHPTADYQEKKQLKVELVRAYENYRCKKITARAWVSDTGKIIAKMNAIDDKDLEFRLYTAHYYITAGRVNEGKWILDKAEKEALDSPGDTLYSYFLYLSTLCSKEESYLNDVAERLEGIFRRNPDNWRIAWLIQYVADEYSSSSPRKWMSIEEQFALGCRSPILYLEAMGLLNETPSILTRLEDFELYVLEYGAKKQIISLNLIDQIVYLSTRVRGYSDRLYRILKACYEVKENDLVLEAIVSLLIKGGKTSKTAFEWYVLGVDRQLRITRLYEYYMMSIYVTDDGTLPCEISKMVLMYFSYQSDLEYDKNAILYRYIHERRQDYPELYETYLPQIEKFLMAQLDRGRINKDLGYLYKNLLTKQMVDAANAPKVLYVINTAEIKTSDKRVNSVCVIYDKCAKEMRYQVTDGKAYVPLYGNDYTVLLTDRDDNRYATTIPYTNIRMMIPGKLTDYAIPYIQKGKENLDLFLCDLGKNAYTIDMDNVSRYRDLADSEYVRKKVKNEIRNNLIRFYYDNDFTRQLTEYLVNIDPLDISSTERDELLELMVMAGLYDKAMEWIKTYGTYSIDPKIILRMCSRMLDRDIYDNGPQEIEIAYYAFSKAKYDEQLLKYLVANFNGTIKEMRDVFRAAQSFGLDTYPLAERMLLQMLYSGSFVGEKIEIFKSYVKSGASTDIEVAFLSQCAYDSFVRGKVTDGFVYERIESLALMGVPLLDVCKLAYLRYYANEKKTGEEYNQDVATAFLRELVDKKTYFPFFTEYEELLPEMVQFTDKTMLEYRTLPQKHCYVHYRFAGEEDNEYKSMEMREMYEGIFVASFVLFFGEQLQYYITEDSETGEDVLTESGTIQKSDIIKTHTGSRFSYINDIMIGETLQDYDTVDKLLLELGKKRFVCDRLFTAFLDNGEEG